MPGTAPRLPIKCRHLRRRKVWRLQHCSLSSCTLNHSIVSMAFLEKQLVVKESTIPGSGKGLFTKKFIPKGTRIVEYKGRITTWKEVKNDSDNGYIYTVNRTHVIDALPTPKALARYANDARGLVKVKGITNNCTYTNEGLQAYIESIKDIPAGAEIFVSYGKDYWKVIRANMQLDKKRKKEKAT
jgi:SET domain-containing protein